MCLVDCCFVFLVQPPIVVVSLSCPIGQCFPKLSAPSPHLGHLLIVVFDETNAVAYLALPLLQPLHPKSVPPPSSPQRCPLLLLLLLSFVLHCCHCHPSPSLVHFLIVVFVVFIVVIVVVTIGDADGGPPPLRGCRNSCSVTRSLALQSSASWARDDAQLPLLPPPLGPTLTFVHASLLLSSLRWRPPSCCHSQGRQPPPLGLAQRRQTTESPTPYLEAD